MFQIDFLITDLVQTICFSRVRTLPAHIVGNPDFLNQSGSDLPVSTCVLTFILEEFDRLTVMPKLLADDLRELLIESHQTLFVVDEP